MKQSIVFSVNQKLRWVIGIFLVSFCQIVIAEFFRAVFISHLRYNTYLFTHVLWLNISAADSVALVSGGSCIHWIYIELCSQKKLICLATFTKSKYFYFTVIVLFSLSFLFSLLYFVIYKLKLKMRPFFDGGYFHSLILFLLKSMEVNIFFYRLISIFAS